MPQGQCGAARRTEDGAIDRLGRQVALERLVNRDSVDVGVVDEPDELVGEELAVVLRVKVPGMLASDDHSVTVQYCTHGSVGSDE